MKFDREQRSSKKSLRPDLASETRGERIFFGTPCEHPRFSTVVGLNVGRFGCVCGRRRIRWLESVRQLLKEEFWVLRALVAGSGPTVQRTTWGRIRGFIRSNVT
jgi:hypothetical protein